MMEIMLYLRIMFLRRIAVACLTLLILFADSGQMIYAHTCLKSNRTSLSLFAPGNCCIKKENKRSCCAKKAAEQEKSCTLGKMSCCSVSTKYIKQSFPSNEVKYSELKAGKDVVIELNLFSAYPPHSAQQNFSYAAIPLPRCKDDIRFTQVFRI
jgi:hypothetical protein